MPSATGYASRQAAQRSASAAAARAPLHLGHTKTSARASACPSMELLHLYWLADEPEATMAERTDWRRVIMREDLRQSAQTTQESGGIGLAIAGRLFDADVDVLIADIDRERLAAAGRSLDGVQTVATDLSSRQEVHALADAAGAVDILI